MLMVATLLYCLFLYGGAHKLFRDSDTGWHIRNGEAILAQRALPAVDLYSFSKPNQPWFAWEWGADVVMGWVHGAGGLPAVTALFAFTIACASWLWVRLNFAMDGDFLLVGLFAPLMITTASPHWLARPHIFSWILLLAWLWFLEQTVAHALLRAASRLISTPGVTQASSVEMSLDAARRSACAS